MFPALFAICLVVIKESKYISDSFINTLEIAVFDLNNDFIFFDFNFYETKEELETIFSKNQEINKIFIGPLTSEDTKFINKYFEKRSNI